MENSKIDWCDSSWNPITGCLHGCQYCYARGIANRFSGGGYGKQNGMFIAKYNDDAFKPPYDLHEPILKRTKNGTYPDAPYPFGFEPTFHRYRLADYLKKKAQVIFVCSMADLFGSWVPDMWISDVFKACEAAPQHTYIFLTKNAERMFSLIESEEFTRRKNYWFGTTMTGPHGDVIKSHNELINTFVSIEPILEAFPENVNAAELPNWIIVGAESGNRKEKVIPDKSWIETIVKQARSAGVPVFMKSSLIPIVGEENMLREFPSQISLAKGPEVAK